MGALYRKETGDIGVATTTPEMRTLVQQPGKMDKDGKPIYFTEQSHKKECDVNEIVKKYDKTGIISHVSKIEAKFGDMTGYDFKAMKDKVANAESMFQELPSTIRDEFDNDPAQLLTFMEDENNRDKAIELGLIRADWTPGTDGLGEHVPEGGNITDTGPAPVEPPGPPA
jgi:phage internal scaffolding protein